MSQPKPLPKDGSVDWKKIKRRVFGVQDQLQKQLDILVDTRDAYLDEQGEPYRGCEKFVECLSMCAASLALTHGVLDDSIDYLINGDGD